MIAHTAVRNARLVALSLALISSIHAIAGHPAQGLWVGEVALNAVNEATGAVGDSNTFEFTDPAITTPTSDTAFIRIILHVNGAGQTNLLKSVAVVEGEPNDQGGSQILLLTDPSLYPQFPGIARRVASAAFDFGDQKAVTAVQSLIDRATTAAVSRVIDNEGFEANDLETQVLADLQPVVAGADVNSAYLNRGTGATSFLTSEFFSEAQVVTIANTVAGLIEAGTRSVEDFALDPAASIYNPFPTDPLAGAFGNGVTAAVSLRDASFFGDTRGLEAIAGVVTSAAGAAAATADAGLADMQAAAAAAAIDARHNAADIDQQYNRFIASATFRAMRTTMAELAVLEALSSQERGRTEAQITADVRSTVLQDAAVAAALIEAVTIRSASLFGDVRLENAVNGIVDALAAVIAAQVLVSQDAVSLMQLAQNTVNAAFDDVEAAPVFGIAPSTEYSSFVRGTSYQSAAQTAARTAAREAVFQYNAGVRRESELIFFTERAVTRDLRSVRNVAAALPQNEIQLQGGFGPGGALNGVIHLPALAPTNPFMHRRHPDHTEGIAITRRIALSFDDSDDGEFARAGYGVSRITGTYFEELFGLHKPLGVNQDIGLRTAGTFTLNRITLTNTLNF